MALWLELTNTAINTLKILTTFSGGVVGWNTLHTTVCISAYCGSFCIKILLGLEYDGSQIPAEWFGWLHYKTDYLPYNDPFRPKHKWMLDHTENLTGTPHQFMPYSTTRQKIVPWKPSNEDNKEC